MNRKIAIGGLVALVAIFLVLERLDIRLCPWAALSGVPCPGCGMVRAMVCLFTGRFTEAVHLHPLAPLFAVLAPVWAAAEVLPRPLISLPRGAWERASLGLGSLLLLVWVARLAGALGGLPDPVDLRAGMIGRIVIAVHAQVAGPARDVETRAP